jgi:hypothetical protein
MNAEQFEIAMIPNHYGFMASKQGEIIGKRGKPLKGHIDRCGYREVLLSENGKSKNYLVHRLVMMTFCPRSDSGELDVNHKNGNKLDNSLENLEWCTRSQNIRHSYDNGLQEKVTNIHGSFRVLNERDFDVIRDLHHRGYLDKEIAKEIGCSRGLVSRKIREWGIRNDHD